MAVKETFGGYSGGDIHSTDKFSEIKREPW
jgi:hypothetical protein